MMERYKMVEFKCKICGKELKDEKSYWTGYVERFYFCNKCYEKHLMNILNLLEFGDIY